MLGRGVWLTFYKEHEPRSLPTLGPFDHVVFGREKLLARRIDVRHDDASASQTAGDLWLAAELELKRALGELVATPLRSSVRLSRPDGGQLFLRFANYDEGQAGAELGPFTSIDIGSRSLKADGKTLAERTPDRRWRLGPACGAEQGAERPDLAVRDAIGAYRPMREAFPARTPAATPPRPVQAPYVEGPAASEPRPTAGRPAVTRSPDAPRPVGGLTRAVAAAPRSEPEYERRADPDGRLESWRDRTRLILIGLAVLVLVGAVGLGRELLFAPRTQDVSTVGLSETVTGREYDVSASGVQRTPLIGTLRANGVFVIVRVTVTNRHGSGQLSPKAFSVVDGRDRSFGALAADSGAYGAPVVWPKSFPPDSPADGSLVFDVDPSATGLRLLVPGSSTRVRLTG